MSKNGEEIELDDLDVLTIVFYRFIEKIQKDGELKFTEDTAEEDIRKVLKEISSDKGDYQEYIDDSLMYFGYRLREDNRVQEQTFQANIEQHYGFIFYHLELIYLLSIKLGELVFNKVLTNDSPLSTLFKMKHVRACSIYSEIIHLIKGGYGTGAMSRYRSLNELAVISEFIFKNGEKAAQAYLDYSEVMKAKDARYLSYLYGDNINITEAMEHFEGIQPALLDKYGDKFVDIKSLNDYEWARPYLKLNKGQHPNFGRIRNDVKRDKGREQYKLSSNNIHAAPKSIISTLGSQEGLPIAGVSNIGIAEPGSWAVYELQQLNSMLLRIIQDAGETKILDNLQVMFSIKLLQRLCNYVYEEFSNVEKELIQEDSIE